MVLKSPFGPLSIRFTVSENLLITFSNFHFHPFGSLKGWSIIHISVWSFASACRTAKQFPKNNLVFYLIIPLSILIHSHINAFPHFRIPTLPHSHISAFPITLHQKRNGNGAGRDACAPGPTLVVVQYMYNSCTILVQLVNVQILYKYCTYIVQRPELVP